MFTKVLIVDDHAAINDGVSSILTSVGVLNIHKALYCDDADLRVKKATRQEFKPHVFKHKKLNLAQLLTIKSQNEIKQLTK